MDFSLKRCTATTTLQDICNNSDSASRLVDRLSGLHDELLIRILSLLPTKEAALTCFSSKRLRSVFPLLTSLELDDSPISHCLERPYRIQHFPSFVTFVDTVIRAHQSQYITRFRLGVGFDVIAKNNFECQKHCLPDVKSVQFRSWISYPLICFGLRELDLCIHVRESADGHQLPPEIFACETLEVLKLGVNLLVDQVSTMKYFHLPNLKLLHLCVSHIYEDGRFVSRLVSCFPLLENLTVQAFLNSHIQSICISLSSLRILKLQINTCDVDNTDILLIHTPELEYLFYSSNQALRQSITKMDRLVKADIYIGDDLQDDELVVSCQNVLNFFSSLSNVHLSLHGSCTEDQLPVLRNLKYLELGNNHFAYWDKVLLAFLKCSPILETLVFPKGLTDTQNDEFERRNCNWSKRCAELV